MIDFDAFRRERKDDRPALTVKVGGDVYPLPRSLPAVVALDILRARRDLGDESKIPPDMVNDVGDALFGKDAFRRMIVKAALDLEDLAALIGQVLELYSEETSPNREARRKAKRSASSTTGRASKPTSSGSTRSTSSPGSTR